MGHRTIAKTFHKALRSQYWVPLKTAKAFIVRDSGEVN